MGFLVGMFGILVVSFNLFGLFLEEEHSISVFAGIKGLSMLGFPGKIFLILSGLWSFISIDDSKKDKQKQYFSHVN